MQDITAILAVDQALVSGWALHVAGSTTCGVARTQFEIAAVVDRVMHHRTVVIFEDHSFLSKASGKVSTKGLLGMGRARGRWEASLDLVHQDAKLRFAVSPREWRRSVLGLENPSREAAKAAAIARASRDLGVDPKTMDENAAEAFCILLWRGWHESLPKTRGKKR